jgi:hypothetical protein
MLLVKLAEKGRRVFGWLTAVVVDSGCHGCWCHSWGVSWIVVGDILDRMGLLGAHAAASRRKQHGGG